MEIFQSLGVGGSMLIGSASIVAEILVAYFFLRSFKIIRRREYVRLKNTEAEHQRHRMFTVDNWSMDTGIPSRGIADVEIKPEFDGPEPIGNRR
jgi:hypothetical protein